MDKHDIKFAWKQILRSVAGYAAVTLFYLIVAGLVLAWVGERGGAL